MNNTKKYSLGLDFGTLSCRAVVASVEDGTELSDAVAAYPHAVIERALPDGTPLPYDFALQHPQDYLDAVASAVPEALRAAGVSADAIAGVGVDFTSCTMLPVRADGTPLCLLPEFAANPHAYVKLWKHHAAQPQADRINALARKRGETWLERYGGSLSCEWMLPKILETLEMAPEVYAAADRFIEAGNWLVWMLSGRETHAAPGAGYKAIWDAESGYPDDGFFAALDPRLSGIVGTKLSRDITPLGGRAGEVDARGAALTSLCPGTPLSAANPDAHVAPPALGITGPGRMLLVLGTSGCHIVTAKEKRCVPGICGVVRDGVLPGLYGYEAGQCCFGDHFDWFVKNCVPGEYMRAAEAEGVSIHAYLRERAARLRPGESGLLALDWWNGNRSVLNDSELSGLIVGLTLRTKPEEIYRALLEATAFGTRMIIDRFVSAGVAVDELCAAGGIARKDWLLMQIFADVTGRSIRVAVSAQAPALASAIYGAAVGGVYPSVLEAAKAMGHVRPETYVPDPGAHAVYERLYAEYVRLHDAFGRGENDVMKRLRALSREASAR